jgi:hypothetical protein
MSTANDWMPLATAAHSAGVSADTLRRRIRDGTLEGHRDNRGRWLVRAADMQRSTIRQRGARRNAPPHSETAEGAPAAHDQAAEDAVLIAELRKQRDELRRDLEAERALAAEERARLLATIERLSDALATRDRGAVSRGLAWARARMRAKDQPQ